jgi:hypothetical protein
MTRRCSSVPASKTVSALTTPEWKKGSGKWAVRPNSRNVGFSPSVYQAPALSPIPVEHRHRMLRTPAVGIASVPDRFGAPAL